MACGIGYADAHLLARRGLTLSKTALWTSATAVSRYSETVKSNGDLRRSRKPQGSLDTRPWRAAIGVMRRRRSPLAVILAILTVVIIAGAFGALRALGATPVGQFRVTNDAHRVVECNLLVDSHTRTYLKVHMGKTYGDSFSRGRLLQLACMRGTEGIFGPLEAAEGRLAYRFVDAPGDRVNLVVGEAP